MASDDEDQCELRDLLDEALAGDTDDRLRDVLVRRSGLPGSPVDFRLVAVLAAAVGDVIRRPEPPVSRLEDLLDGWAALSEQEAPADAPDVILPCAAVAAYGEAAVVRPDWFDDEMGKLRRAAGDPRPRVREGVAQAIRRVLASDRSRTIAELAGWADDDNPLVVQLAIAAVTDPA